MADSKPKGQTLAGLSAELKKTKAEVKAQKILLAKQMAEARRYAQQQRAAMESLIKSGKVPANVNQKDNNQNKNRNVKPKQGPKKPTKAEEKLQKIRSTVKNYKTKTSGKGAGGNVRNATIGMGFPKPELVKFKKKK